MTEQARMKGEAGELLARLSFYELTRIGGKEDGRCEG